MALTYLISVVSAGVSGRAFAAEVDGLGSTPADVVSAGWDGSRYGDLALPLQSLGRHAGFTPGKFVQSAEDGLPTPDLEPLRRAGTPVLEHDDFARGLRSEQERRKKLRGLLNAHGWRVARSTDPRAQL